MSDGSPVRMTSKAPKLEDVARLAGVSTATVSRCLNQPDVVVEKTRKRVLKAVQELGYAPNFNARALAARSTQTIGAVIPTMNNAIFAEGIQAFQEALQAKGYTLLVATSSYHADQEADAIRTLVARGADAVLTIGFDRDPSVYTFLEKRGVPVLIAWAYDATSAHTCIGFDSRAAMAGLVEHALGLGHRRVGMISAPMSGNDRARARVAGVRDALQTFGVPKELLELIETDYGLSQGGDAFESLLSFAPDVTLIVGGNDVLAAGAIRRAVDLGYAVPDAVSVIGFDDIALSRLVSPRLTTVRVPHQEMGAAAARALVDMLDGKPAQSQELVTKICLRDSLGPPPS